MKTIVLTDDVMQLLAKEKSFLQRNDVKLFTVATSDDILSIHRAEKADVIITSLLLPGLKSEELCSTIRSDVTLRKVSVILLCPNNAADLERCARSKATAVVTLPVDSRQLLEKVQQLLNICRRESYRVLVSLIVEGSSKGGSFFGRSGNISTTGMLIETEKVLVKGDRLLCSFFLPDAGQIKAHGDVVRIVTPAAGSKSFQYGISFQPLDAEAKSAIDDFVERKSQISTSRK